jgi:galactokinase
LVANKHFDLIVKSPGRINLIGEHIDYNGGHVLPAAINLNLTIRFKKKEGNVCHVNSKVKNGFKFNIHETLKPKSNNHWGNYVLGVIDGILKLRPQQLSAFDCKIESDLPIGSGISSSAALECGITFGLNTLFNLNLSELEQIKIAQKAEHDFVGTKCGIMDQFAVTMGQEKKVILLNCETLKYELLDANIDPYKIVLLNTNVEHKLASSEYNNRRKECEKAMEIIKSKYTDYHHLAEVPIDVIKTLENELDELVLKRATYVAEEEKRTINASKVLQNGDIIKFGELMYASHDGLSNKYDVSCPELDFLVDYSKKHNSVIGSRMMGGGFGGCTINLIHEDYIQSYIESITEAYKDRFDQELSSFKVSISKGVSLIN